MRHVLKSLGLLLLLIVAQQGAVVHELSHLPALGTTTVAVDTRGSADTSCALCPAFAQVATPAFSHAFHIPLLVRVEADRFPELRYEAVEAAVPTPRSRGPPSLS